MAATLDWYGCATFRLSLPGVVVYLDAYIDRVPDAPGPGLTADDVDKADWILVGHSHFDHLWGAERIARRTGATIVGSYETVRIMAEQGVPDSQLVPVSGGERLVLAPGVTAAVFPSLHSCVWTHTVMPQCDVVCVGDLGVTYQEQQERLRAMKTNMRTALGAEAGRHVAAGDQHPRGDGGALLYVIDTPDGSILYQDTSGHWGGILQNLRPDVAILAAAGRGNVDGDPVQGSLADFVARQAALCRPRKVILSHHDDWLPGFSVDTDPKPIEEQLARLAPRSTLATLGYLDGHDVFG